MSLVEVINSAEDFHRQIRSTQLLVIVDFSATWCGPCKNIEPFFNTLSLSYANKAKFFKVDVDKLPNIALEYQVNSMPTFILFRNGNKLDKIIGADREKLVAKLYEFTGSQNAAAPSSSTTAATSAPSLLSSDSAVPLDGGNLSGIDLEIKGQMDLEPLINKANCECLNEHNAHSLSHMFQKGGGYLASGDDEQLIIFLTFTQVVKLHSIKFFAPKDRGPKRVKLYANQPSTPDFDECTNAEGVQHLELTAEDLDESTITPLKYVKFQKVSSLTLFVENNQEDSSETQIDRLILFGSPVKTTNMNEFKKIEQPKM